MRRSFGRSRGHTRGLLLAAIALAAVVVGLVVFVTTNGSNPGLRVLVIVPHPTVSTGGLDRIETVNDSRYQVGETSCGIHLTARTSAGFAGGPGRNCGDYSTMPRHALVYEGNPTGRPGKYWVWIGYRRRGSHTVHLAYAKLTVTGPVPDPVALVVGHGVIRAGVAYVVEGVNKGQYPASPTGCGGPAVTPRTSAHFTRPHDLFCAGGVGPTVPAHSRARLGKIAEAPGRYWVWFDYFYGPAGIGETAYAKLTVRRT